MEPETNKSSTDGSFIDERVNISHVTAVATGWISDFMFVTMCRLFKEGNFDEFNEMLSTSEAFFDNPSLKGGLHNKKTLICAFLTRVMYGKELDAQFQEDEHIMPLMSAAKIWSDLEETVADENLFKNVAALLLVQSVAVCLEKGQRSAASSALKWFENNQKFPRNLGAKLSTIVTQEDTYHPFLTRFSFSRLLEAVQAYLDAYLEKNPSDYLLKAATKMVQSSQSTGGVEDAVTRDSSVSETANKSTEERKTKRKLLSTKFTDVWKPDSCKKLIVSVRRISSSEISCQIPGKSVDTSKLQKTRKVPQKWTAQLDKYLKDGVKRHGQGKWSRILMDYDFQGRTGTMLKDRWRVLLRAHKVG